MNEDVDLPDGIVDMEISRGSPDWKDTLGFAHLKQALVDRGM